MSSKKTAKYFWKQLPPCRNAPYKLVKSILKGVMSMERTLKNLFDYQKFEGNAALQSVIDSVHSRYPVRELNMDEMEWVNAAGTLTARPAKEDGSEPDGSIR